MTDTRRPDREDKLSPTGRLPERVKRDPPFQSFSADFLLNSQHHPDPISFDVTEKLAGALSRALDLLDAVWQGRADSMDWSRDAASLQNHAHKILRTYQGDRDIPDTHNPDRE